MLISGDTAGNISIHALREEGDDDDLIYCEAKDDFYPRPPRGGRPRNTGTLSCTTEISIHALREEGDPASRTRWRRLMHFYPRPPRGGRLIPLTTGDRAARFLSTPSARRATYFIVVKCQGEFVFLSTPSARRATHGRRDNLCSSQISIHALREEGDLAAFRLPAPTSYFYPRPPRGGRRKDALDKLEKHLFLSTPSARRATP